MDKIKILLLNDKAIVVYSKILRSILAIGITYVIFRMITALAKKVISKNEKTSDDRKMKTVTSVVRSLFKYLFYILVFYIALFSCYNVYTFMLFRRSCLMIIFYFYELILIIN